MSDRKWHIVISYGVGGITFALLPLLMRAGVVAGFAGLIIVIVGALAPNGCLLALAATLGAGPALPLNLAVFNSIGNFAGLLGPWLMGYVVGRTCSYDAAFIALGVVLALGGLLATRLEDRGAARGDGDGVPTAAATVALAELVHGEGVACNGAVKINGSGEAEPVPLDSLDEM